MPVGGDFFGGTAGDRVVGGTVLPGETEDGIVPVCPAVSVDCSVWPVGVTVAPPVKVG